jgi:hypothetical protein
MPFNKQNRMSKKICKNAQEIPQIGDPLFQCAKCKQKAIKEKHLCKPKKIGE